MAIGGCFSQQSKSSQIMCINSQQKVPHMALRGEQGPPVANPCASAKKYTYLK